MKSKTIEEDSDMVVIFKKNIVLLNYNISIISPYGKP
ncbi:hypothetical protein SAMN05421593_0429 [Chryseobacterium culicis]|uniref:Uncharacterized protein n=1 Tax=Chryseobacterium culicis TaxID=680127 RepID=A0A1H6GWV9_CHRCI|nr:hypothetical protein SAMN05421593_0429 [Chryseobacterium culicis]